MQCSKSPQELEKNSYQPRQLLAPALRPLKKARYFGRSVMRRQLSDPVATIVASSLIEAPHRRSRRNRMPRADLARPKRRFVAR
jgi:hypothetical protein